MGQEFSNWKC